MKNSIYAVVFLFIVSSPFSVADFTVAFSHAEKEAVKTDWNYFIEALILVESEGNPHAVGKTNDAGILQITPIYVAEANRIQKEKVYTLECRFDTEKSIEMFNIIQNKHNPNRDIDKAIKLHNPRAGQWYADRIKTRMEQLKLIAVN